VPVDLPACLWLEDGNKPLVRVAVGCSATIASRESPVSRFMGGYLSRVDVLCLEDDQRRDCSTATLTHSMVVIHSFRPTITFQLDFSRTLTNALED
jgi:hypothetical protein